MNIKDSQLGKKSQYISEYDPKLLFALARQDKRNEILRVGTTLPFYGVDIWNAYEISWLNPKGKPCVCIGEIIIDALSSNIIESKSMKLYLNSYNNTRFSSLEEVQLNIKKDISEATESNVIVNLIELGSEIKFGKLQGNNIDNIDIDCTDYESTDTNLLVCYDDYVLETLNSNLLKSNCLITNQPDWGSVEIRYSGKRLDRSSLLKYIVSFRNYNEFHEQCVEKIFINIFDKIQPNYLSVYARYTRRGGVDICPYRTTDKNFCAPSNHRLVRQ